MLILIVYDNIPETLQRNNVSTCLELGNFILVLCTNLATDYTNCVSPVSFKNNVYLLKKTKFMLPKKWVQKMNIPNKRHKKSLSIIGRDSISMKGVRLLQFHVIQNGGRNFYFIRSKDLKEQTWTEKLCKSYSYGQSFLWTWKCDNVIKYAVYSHYLPCDRKTKWEFL